MYSAIQRRWATVNQAALNRNVFRCFLKAESELQSRMFDGRETVPDNRCRVRKRTPKSVVSFGTVSRGLEIFSSAIDLLSGIGLSKKRPVSSTVSHDLIMMMMTIMITKNLVSTLNSVVAQCHPRQKMQQIC